MTPDALARTHGAAFGDHGAWKATEFAELLRQNAMILCGDARSFVLGRVTVDEAEILTIATDPADQRKGLARIALTQFEKAAQKQGARRIFLEVATDNFAAITLYKNSNYQQIGLRQNYYRRADDTKADARVMEKRLE